MFGNMLTMLTTKTLELTTLSKSGKSLTGRMLKEDFYLLLERNDDLVHLFSLFVKNEQLWSFENSLIFFLSVNKLN